MMAEECPECKADLDIYNFWWKVIVPDSNQSEFEFTCMNCETLLTVTVEQTPLFIIKPSEDAN